MPSVWVSFVNILYISDCEQWSGAQLTEFLQLWFMQPDFEGMMSRDLYLAGNLEDEQGGKYLFEIARILQQVYQIAGIVAANSKHTPVMRFTAHRSFETNNNMTDWTVNRARQDITCNGYFSEVEFLMHDVHLHYRPKRDIPSSVDARHAHFEYELAVASTPDLCYSDMDVFETEWSTRQLPRGTTTHPRLQSTTEGGGNKNNVTELFPMCGDDHDSNGTDTTSGDGSSGRTSPRPTADGKSAALDPSLPEWLTNLLESNVKIVLYNYLQKSSQAICNFYIGIYESDSSKFHISDDKLHRSAPVNRMLEQFNHATLEEMSAVWTSGATSGATIAWLQDGLEVELPAATASSTIISAGESVPESATGEAEASVLSAVPDPTVQENAASTHTARSSTSSTSQGGLVWMQFDDRYVPETYQSPDSTSIRKSKRPLFGYLTKSTAVEILAHVLGKHHPSEGGGDEGGVGSTRSTSVIDFVDLFV